MSVTQNELPKPETITKYSKPCPKVQEPPPASQPASDSPPGPKEADPQIFQVAQIAAMLALKRSNRTASAANLSEQAAEILGAAATEVRELAREKSFLIATVAKMHHPDASFLHYESRNKRLKGFPLVKFDDWDRIFKNYKGEKVKLFSEICSVEVDRNQLLRELFPTAKASDRRQQFLKLIEYAEKEKYNFNGYLDLGGGRNSSFRPPEARHHCPRRGG
jgi:hypothetical protein